MQLWWVVLVIGVLVVLIGLELARRNRRASASAESYYGPLPEREAERAELNDPAQFGQVTPGAVIRHDNTSRAKVADITPVRLPSTTSIGAKERVNLSRYVAPARRRQERQGAHAFV